MSNFVTKNVDQARVTQTKNQSVTITDAGGTVTIHPADAKTLDKYGVTS